MDKGMHDCLRARGPQAGMLAQAHTIALTSRCTLMLFQQLEGGGGTNFTAFLTHSQESFTTETILKGRKQSHAADAAAATDALTIALMQL
eukprot:1155541-Pelagomonas_calceolata.AAC.4